MPPRQATEESPMSSMAMGHNLEKQPTLKQASGKKRARESDNQSHRNHKKHKSESRINGTPIKSLSYEDVQEKRHRSVVEPNQLGTSEISGSRDTKPDDPDSTAPLHPLKKRKNHTKHRQDMEVSAASGVPEPKLQHNTVKAEQESKKKSSGERKKEGKKTKGIGFAGMRSP